MGGVAWWRMNRQAPLPRAPSRPWACCYAAVLRYRAAAPFWDQVRPAGAAIPNALVLSRALSVRVHGMLPPTLSV